MIHKAIDAWSPHIRETFGGSFSIVWTPIFTIKYSLESIDPRSHGPTFPPGFYLAARPIYDLASAVSASATDVIADQIAGGKIGEKESRDRALAQSTPATSSTPSKRSLPSRPSRPAPTA